MVLKRQGIWPSYLIGTPIGLLTVLVVLSIPSMLTGEGLATMAIMGIYGKAILGLVASFLIALGFAGNIAAIDFENQKPLLKSSFKYSVIVNLIIWTVFVLITIADNFGSDIWLYITPPIIAFLICTATTTFTLGLLICYVIKNRVTKDN